MGRIKTIQEAERDRIRPEAGRGESLRGTEDADLSDMIQGAPGPCCSAKFRIGRAPVWVISTGPYGSRTRAYVCTTPESYRNSADQASGAPCRPHLTQGRMTMEDENSILPPPKSTPWNKGKLIGAKQVEV
jgi:hypothetical protein